MRHRFILAGLFVLTVVTGCGTTRFDWLKGGDKSAPAREVPPVAKLVAYLNDNSSRVQSVTYEHIDLTITNTKNFQSFNLTASLRVQQPLNFRMKANFISKEKADIGSNDQEFWWWNSEDQKPYQYYCSYKDLREGRVRDLNFPIQPEWIIEALGLASNYGPPERYKIEHDAETVRLVENAKLPNGKPIRKVIVFQAPSEAAAGGNGLRFLLLDGTTSKEICSAHISEVYLDSGRDHKNGYVPRKIELSWPEMQLKLTLNMDRPSVNAPIPATAFVRPSLNGIASFNLASGTINQVQHVQEK